MSRYLLPLQKDEFIIANRSDAIQNNLLYLMTNRRILVTQVRPPNSTGYNDAGRDLDSIYVCNTALEVYHHQETGDDNVQCFVLHTPEGALNVHGFYRASGDNMKQLG